MRVYDSQNWCVGSIEWVDEALSKPFVHDELRPGSTAALVTQHSGTPENRRKVAVWFQVTNVIEVRLHFRLPTWPADFVIDPCCPILIYVL